MKIHRFIGAFEIEADRFLIRDRELVHQLRTVLKLQAGEKIIVADGQGTEALVAVRALAKEGVDVEVIERRPIVQLKNEVVLYAAILKRENFEYIVEKAVECGVGQIVPVVTARTIKLGVSPERLEKIMKEAAEQCGRGAVPVLTTPLNFKKALVDAATNDTNYFFDAGGRDIFSVHEMSGRSGQKIGVWIGPEGGWSDDESLAAKEVGFKTVGLGPLVLRAETAAAVAVYLAAR